MVGHGRALRRRLWLAKVAENGDVIDMNFSTSSRWTRVASIGSAVLAVMLGVVNAPEAVAAAVHSAVTAAPRPDEGARRRFEELSQRVKEQGASAEVVFLGDSITQGWESEGKEVWARRFAPRKALNLGISGDRTQHVLWRSRTAMPKGCGRRSWC